MSESEPSFNHMNDSIENNLNFNSKFGSQPSSNIILE